MLRYTPLCSGEKKRRPSRPFPAVCVSLTRLYHVQLLPKPSVWPPYWWNPQIYIHEFFRPCSPKVQFDSSADNRSVFGARQYPLFVTAEMAYPSSLRPWMIFHTAVREIPADFAKSSRIYFLLLLVPNAEALHFLKTCFLPPLSFPFYYKKGFLNCQLIFY